MKTISLAFLSLLFFGVNCFARIGETLSECTNRYGAGVSLSGNQYCFIKNKIKIIIEFDQNGKVGCIRYTKDLIPIVADGRVTGFDPNPFDEHEIRQLMLNNSRLRDGWEKTDNEYSKSDGIKTEVWYYHDSAGQIKQSAYHKLKPGKLIMVDILEIYDSDYLNNVAKEQRKRTGSNLDGF